MLNIKKLRDSIISLSVAHCEAVESIAESVTKNSFLQGCIMGVIFNTPFIFYGVLTILFG